MWAHGAQARDPGTLCADLIHLNFAQFVKFVAVLVFRAIRGWLGGATNCTD